VYSVADLDLFKNLQDSTTVVPEAALPPCRHIAIFSHQMLTE
jgi:hypothetical protein